VLVRTVRRGITPVSSGNSVKSESESILPELPASDKQTDGQTDTHTYAGCRLCGGWLATRNIDESLSSSFPRFLALQRPTTVALNYCSSTIHLLPISLPVDSHLSLSVCVCVCLCVCLAVVDCLHVRLFVRLSITPVYLD